jgi:probable rRNA maturation factor
VRLRVERTPGNRLPAGTRDVVERLARRMPPAGLSVQLVVADDRLLRRLNREFRGKDRPTDVLSFRYDAPASVQQDDPGAEVYVSMQRVRIQARERNVTAAREFVQLVLHGLLHVQGHDHHRVGEARRMRAAERLQLDWIARTFGWRRLQPLVSAQA